MSTDVIASDFFVAGGTLHPDARSYVQRPADDELFGLALASEFCYVLTPRQMGKSSLMIRTARRLQEQGVKTAIIDLTSIGTGVTADQWYLGLVTRLNNQLKLSVDPQAWWEECASLGALQRFTDFLHDVVLAEIEGPVVVFIDEIDTTLNLDFSDDFFAAIRFTYNARASDQDYNRLTFVLLGVAAPADLIKNPGKTPFNIGHRIDLHKFSWEDSWVLRQGLEAIFPEQGEAIFTRIYRWTDGHPYLTQKLCLAVVEEKEGCWSNEQVDHLVERLFLSEEARRETNLQFVRDRILNHAQCRQLLMLYRDVHKGKGIPDDERSFEQSQLKLAGLVRAEGGQLLVRNEIYRCVFDLAWVRENTPVNWAPIVASIAVLVALAAVGAIIYNHWIDRRVDAYVLNFYQARTPEEQLADLATIFRVQGLLGSRDYDDRAIELFYEMEDPLALFDVSDVEESDLIEVTRGLYVTLADVYGAENTGLLLGAMAKTLGRVGRTEEAVQFKQEIIDWHKGRELVRQGMYSQALDTYNKTIASYGENPATLYERARVLMNLSEPRQALNDLDQVMAIARRARVPSATPTTSTLTPAASSRVTTTNTPKLDTHATPLAGDFPATESPPSSTVPTASPPALTEVPTSTSAYEPVSIHSEFATLVEITSAVKQLVHSDPDLVSLLASAPDPEYPNLRDFGLIPTPIPTAILPVIAGYSTSFTEILPEGWLYIGTYRMDTNHDDEHEWIILYRFDLPEKEAVGSPIGAIIYQLDDKTPASLVPHDLHPPDGDYLCECICTPALENVLSGWDGDELVFYDLCGDQISRLTIFHWDENSMRYAAAGHFGGTCIEVALDEVTVREPMQDRAQLSECLTYHARDNRTYYQPGGTGAQVLPEREEIVFSKGEPEDILRTPYPEKVVLAFYQNYTDDETAPAYFVEKVRDHLGQCDAGECGCVAPRHEIARVRVTYLQPETYDQEPGADAVRATVGVRVICEPRNGSPVGERFVRWHLVREGDQWQLERPE